MSFLIKFLETNCVTTLWDQALHGLGTSMSSAREDLGQQPIQSVLLGAYFENTNLFQCDWYIRGQFDHDMNFTFAYMWFYPWETLGEHKKPLPAELSCTEYRKHISNICLPATSAHHAIHNRCYVPSDFGWHAHHFTITHKMQTFCGPPSQLNFRPSLR